MIIIEETEHDNVYYAADTDKEKLFACKSILENRKRLGYYINAVYPDTNNLKQMIKFLNDRVDYEYERFEIEQLKRKQ